YFRRATPASTRPEHLRTGIAVPTCAGPEPEVVDAAGRPAAASNATERRLAGGKPLRSQLRSTRSLSYVTRPSRPHEPLRYRRRPHGLIASNRVRGWVGAMNADRRVRLWSLVVERAEGGAVSVAHVCAAAMSV